MPASRMLYSMLHWAKAFTSRLIKAQTRAVKWDFGQGPLVSVVIPCYNHGQYIPEALESVLAQTWQNFEIIVVDDGSTDPDTIRVLSELALPRTTVLRHPLNRGLPAARNTGILHAKGRYICPLDADDKFHPTYLEKVLLVMETNQSIDFTYSWVQVFGNENRVWYAPQFDPRILPYYNQSSPLGCFRRWAWEHSGRYREAMRLGYEDWEFWIRMAYHGHKGYRIPEKLVCQRRVGRGFAHAAKERHEQLFADIQRFNPEVYRETEWKVRLLERKDRFAVPPFLNLAPRFFRPWRNPVGWLNVEPASLFRKHSLNAVRAWMESHQGDFVFVSFTVLDEAILDALFSRTPYVYVLPHYLPRHTWGRFVNLLRERGVKFVSRKRGKDPVGIKVGRNHR